METGYKAQCRKWRKRLEDDCEGFSMNDWPDAAAINQQRKYSLKNRIYAEKESENSNRYYLLNIYVSGLF